MSPVAQQPRFIFHGNAMPFGGRIIRIDEKPNLATIAGPPAAALAVVGGLSQASGGASKPHDSFSWKSTAALAKGELLANGRYVTTVTSSISGAWARNQPHVFEADLLRVTLVSEHVYPKAASIRISEAVFGGPGGMKLGGDRIDVEQNSDLNAATTMEAFLDRYQTDKAFFARHQDPVQTAKVRFGDPIPRTPGGYAKTSIVDRIRWRGQVIQGHILRLSGFGAIYFGEVLIHENNRRLTMVRLEMGSAVRADVAYAEADPNGNWGI